MQLKSLILKRIRQVKEKQNLIKETKTQFWIAGRIYGLRESQALIKESSLSKDIEILCNEVLKFSHGDDLVDLHDSAYYLLKTIKKGGI